MRVEGLEISMQYGVILTVDQDDCERLEGTGDMTLVRASLNIKSANVLYACTWLGKLRLSIYSLWAIWMPASFLQRDN